MTKPIMIMGCTSDAGKSFVVAGLCRMFANRGVNVAPFKAQNMSNNAAVTAKGEEIGRAQYLQAIAAKVTPDVRMNPILLKPSADTKSQLILNGKPAPELSEIPWMERKAYLFTHVEKALADLQQEYQQIIIEGAGSPAEVNLRPSDIVNMSVALACNADVYLVADIDKGGAFAHLLGTFMCLAKEEQQLIKGFVLNKFRGDPLLLGNAMDWLEDKTGVPTVANIHYFPHRLPEEDTLHHRAVYQRGHINIALIAYPYAANMDEFDNLIHQDNVNVVPLRDGQSLVDFDAIILPGSKNTAASLLHLRESGLANEISKAAQRGQPILGICGGMQLLGEHILDPHHIEGGDEQGLGLLPIITAHAQTKTTRQRDIDWQGFKLSGYEIHHGQTEMSLKGDAQTTTCKNFIETDLGWQQGNVYGCYLHGLFDNKGFINQFLTNLGWEGDADDHAVSLDAELNRVADMFEKLDWL
ncbi:MAG: cobyric acid synthase [Moritella sp.]|uniref:cobyric acid synthase n=1 Tax=Moritella sp. PE36 TaxID=58051 RepID=UPI0001569D77|nr:cobyric acid synthase [Moritella sp. PE36]EDM66634.1 cobyric acid synthase [Moritella sp. PE36]PHR89805.1 MAG: cobyric acid synthase [Moritella sp.]